MNLPPDLRRIIDAEQTDFVVKAAKNTPTNHGLGILLFSLLWLAFTSIFLFVLLRDNGIGTNERETPDFRRWENWASVLGTGVFLGFFILIGVSLLIYSLVLTFQKGGFFVGTETRLIKFRNGKVTVKDWEQFNGNIKIDAKSGYGNLELELRSGRTTKRKQKSGYNYEHDKIHMVGIENVFEIEKKCRLRIQEHDPNPAKPDY